MASICPSPPFPGYVEGSASHRFALSMVVIFPIYLFAALVVFHFASKDSLYLRKRPFSLLLLNVAGAMVPYLSTAVFDFMGSEHFNCSVFYLMVYMSNTALCYPVVLKLTGYYEKVATVRLQRQLQTDPSVLGKEHDPFRREMSTSNFVCYIKFVFCRSRRESDKINALRFTQTIGSALVWFFLTAFPFFLAFCIRIGMNPQWVHCVGCELEPVDAGAILGIALAALICSAIANPSFFTWNYRESRRDPLWILRECMLCWHVGGVFFNLAMILHLIDPQGIYFTQRLFNWRTFTLFSAVVLIYIQTFHQVLVSGWIRKKVLLASSMFSREEKFQQVLCDKGLLRKLETFLDFELTGEILQFILAVHEFKKLSGQRSQQQQQQHVYGETTLEQTEDVELMSFASATSNNGPEATLDEKAQFILNTYVLEASPREINVRSDMRLRAMDAPVSATMFDEVYEEVKTNFLNDSFARFLKRLGEETGLKKARRQVASQQALTSTTSDKSSDV